MAKILIVMPTATGTIPSEMVKFLFNMQNPDNCQIGYFPINRMTIALARNEALRVAIRDNYDYVWFLDDDNIPEQSDALGSLVLSGKNMICGLVPTRETKEGKYNLCMYKKTFNEYGFHNYTPFFETPQNKLQELDACGMGCVLISKKIFEKLYRKYYGCPFEMRNMWYYRTSEGTKSEDDIRHGENIETKARYCRYVSESILFSERVKKEGFDIFSTNLVTCTHIGNNEIINISHHCDLLNKNIND